MAPHKVGLIDIGSNNKIQETLMGILKNLDAELVPLDLSREIPKGVVGVFFVLSKFYILQPEEIERIKTYISNGNRIAFFLGYESIEFIDITFYSLLKWLGVTIRPELVTSGPEITIKIFRDHFITRGINVIRLQNPISFLTSPENLIIAATSFDEKVANAPVVIHGKKNKGEFLVIGSYKILESDIKDKQIMRLLSNVACWLFNDEECLKKIQKGEEETRIEKTKEEIDMESELEKIEELKIDTIPEVEKKKDIIISLTQSDYDKLFKTLKNFEEMVSEISSLKDSLAEVIELLKKLEKNQSKIINEMEKLLNELSNLEIDLLEAMRDDIGAVSQLISKVDAVEKKLDRKLDKILEKLM